jgi:hypothetical protein
VVGSRGHELATAVWHVFVTFVLAELGSDLPLPIGCSSHHRRQATQFNQLESLAAPKGQYRYFVKSARKKSVVTYYM